jgi:hypothetical protein
VAVMLALLAHLSISSFSSSVTRNCIICVFMFPLVYVSMNDELYVKLHDVSRSLRLTTHIFGVTERQRREVCCIRGIILTHSDVAVTPSSQSETRKLVYQL